MEEKPASAVLSVESKKLTDVPVISSDVTKKKIKIPTILGIILLIAGVVTTIALLERGGRLIPKASSTCSPSEVKITNFSDKRLSLSFTTNEPCLGTAAVTNSSGQTDIFFDERDKEGGVAKQHKNHYLEIDRLEPEKTYKLFLNSGQTEYGLTGQINNSCKKSLTAVASSGPFVITTPVSLSTVSLKSSPINGKIMADDTTAAAGAMVCVDITGLAPLSGITTNSGFWFIPVSGILLNDLKTEASNIADNLSEEIFVTGENGQKSLAVNVTGNDNPVKVIYLGNSYDFKNRGYESSGDTNQQGNNVSPTLPPSNNPAISPTITQTGQNNGFDTESESTTLELIAPKGSVNDTLPVFKGKGPANQSLQINIQSTPINATVKVGSDGFWSFVPPSNLEPGEHTVTLTVIDEEGNVQKITRKFIVTGNSPLLPITSGSGSATLSPTISLPTIAHPPTIYVVPTVAPTEMLTATPTVTSYNGQLPNTASTTPFILLLTIGILGATLGIVIKLKVPK